MKTFKQFLTEDKKQLKEEATVIDINTEYFKEISLEYWDQDEEEPNSILMDVIKDRNNYLQFIKYNVNSIKDTKQISKNIEKDIKIMDKEISKLQNKYDKEVLKFALKYIDDIVKKYGFQE